MKGERAHTSGPWFIGNITQKNLVQVMVKDSQGEEFSICDLWGGVYDDSDVPLTKEQKANAELIAAAPDLLEKCEKIVAWLDRLADKSSELAKDTRFVTLAEANAADAKNYRKTADDIRIVIKKARGAK